jgi:hypothetical protein
MNWSSRRGCVMDKPVNPSSTCHLQGWTDIKIPCLGSYVCSNTCVKKQVHDIVHFGLTLHINIHCMMFA